MPSYRPSVNTRYGQPRKIELPVIAQGSATAPAVPLIADVHGLVESICREQQKPFKPAWATFVHEYLVDANAARAAKVAGFGKSEKAFPVRAARLLQHPVIIEALARLRRQRHEALRVEADDVLLNLVRIASFDPRQLVYADGERKGKRKDLLDLSDDVAACIAAIEFDDDGAIKKLRFWNKNQALEVLAKHLGLLQAPDASAQLPGGVGALLTLLQPSHLTRLSDAEVEQVAGVIALAKRIVHQAHAALPVAPVAAERRGAR